MLTLAVEVCVGSAVVELVVGAAVLVEPAVEVLDCVGSAVVDVDGAA